MAEVSVGDASKKSRGRYRVVECWTRLIDADADPDAELKLYPLATDKLVCSGLPGLEEMGDQVEWEPFFCPKAFMASNAATTPEAFLLSDNKMLKLGKQVTLNRTELLDQAEQMLRGDLVQLGTDKLEVERLAKKLKTRASTWNAEARDKT